MFLLQEHRYQKAKCVTRRLKRRTLSESSISAYRDNSAHIESSAYVDITVRIIGGVHVEHEASVWPMAVLRADSAEIHVGRRAAVLDLSLIEAPVGYPVWVEEEALISHGAIIHGARVQSRALVGIGAIILDGATISSGSIVGAASLVTAGMQVPSNSLVLGVPGRIVRETTAQERQTILDQLEELHRKARHLQSWR